MTELFDMPAYVLASLLAAVVVSYFLGIGLIFGFPPILDWFRRTRD